MPDHQLEQLNDETFQQLVQVLLLADFPDLQCLPVGQPDGGRDAIAGTNELGDRGTIVQVKFVRNPAKIENVAKWAEAAIEPELKKIDRLAERGADRYFFVSNVEASSHLDAGSVDKVHSYIQENVAIPGQALWRSDINRRLEFKPDVRLEFPQLLTAADVLRRLHAETEDRQSRALLAYMQQQHEFDREIRFKQIDLQRDLLNLFMDAPVQLASRPSRRLRNEEVAAFRAFEAGRRTGPGNTGVTWDDQFGSRHFGRDSVSAAGLLLDSNAGGALGRMVVEGAPGQGKSTLAQYLCQVHRIKLLQKDAELARLDEDHASAPVRIPFKIDLRRLSTFLQSTTGTRSLEAHLADEVARDSGGASFTVDDLHAVVAKQPVLLMLDGLDEVADIDDRTGVVAAVESGVNRLSAVAGAAHLQTVVTSRPAAFSNSPGFSDDSWSYVRLSDLPRHLALEYTKRWSKAKGLATREQEELAALVSQVLSSAHLADLGRNIMQLSILLFLIRTKGSSLPDKRTALYDRYVEVFFDREAEKSSWVRDHRMELEGLHRVLGWILHSEAEQGSNGSISEHELREFVDEYLKAIRSAARAEDIFQGTVERLVMLVSRFEGVFEFEVQPLREYFCARYLYEEAPYSPPGDEQIGTKPERFRALAQNPFWLNVARFFAGCHSRGELPGLAQEVMTLWGDEMIERSGYARQLAWNLLSDYVFAQDAVTQELVVTGMLEGLGSRHVIGGEMFADPMPPISEAAVRQTVFERCVEFSASRPARANELQHLASTMARSEEWASHRWLALMESAPTGTIVNHLSFGRGANLILNADPDRLRDQLDRLDGSDLADALAIVLSAGNVAVVRRIDPDYSLVASAFLESLPSGWHVPNPNEDPLWSMGRFAEMAYLVWSPRSSDNSSLSDVLSEPFGDVGSSVAATGYAGEISSPQLVESATKLDTLMKRSLREWTTSVRIWDEAAELMLEVGGETSGWLNVGFAGSVVPSDEGVPESELHDSNVGIATRLSTARSRANSVSYWKTALADAPSTVWVARTVGLCVAFASGPTLMKLRESIDAQLANLSDSEIWEASYVAFWANLPARKYPSIRPERLKWSSMPDGLLAGLLSTRCERAGLVWLFRNAAWGDSRNAFTVSRRSVCMASSFERGDLAIDQFLDELDDMHGRGFTHHPKRFRSGLPLRAAARVLHSPERFPSSLVAGAEQTYFRRFQRSAVPVSQVGREQNWCPYPRH